MQGEEGQHKTSAYEAQELSTGVDDLPKIFQLYTYEMEGEDCSRGFDAFNGT